MSRHNKRVARRSGSYRTKKRAMRQNRLRRETVYWVLAGIVAVAFGWLVLQMGEAIVGGISHWWQARQAAIGAAKGNQPVTIAVIGVDSRESTKVADSIGMIQIVPNGAKVRGITVPGATFVEVPGQGFERASEALRAGPETAMATVSNLFQVPIDRYVTLDVADYKALTQTGLASVLFARPVATNVPQDERARLARIAAAVPPGDALVVPLPVKTISVGDDIYFEAQKEKIADVLKGWWGVTGSAETPALRIKILNGVGTPGIGGVAAKPLIRAGFQVVDTTNAKDFRQKYTRVIVYRGTKEQVAQIVKLLGVGRVQSSDLVQDVVDVVIVIGKDYKPPKSS